MKIVKKYALSALVVLWTGLGLFAQNKTDALQFVDKKLIKPSQERITAQDLTNSFARVIQFADSTRFRTYSMAQIKALPNALIQLTNVFYCNDKGKQGFWRYDPNDNTSADNIGTIWVTNGGLRLKRDYTGSVFPTWFGAVGDGITNDWAAIQRMLQALTDNNWSPLYNRPSGFSSAEIKMLRIDLGGLSYKVEKPITLPTPTAGTISRLGEFTMENGLIMIGDSLAASGKAAFELYNGEKIVFDRMGVVGKAGDVTGRKAFNLTGVCIDVLFRGVIINEVERGVIAGDTCFDVRFEFCNFRNFGSQAAQNFIELKNTDCMIQGTFLINSVTPIILRAGNHLISGNHFYAVQGLYGIDITGSSIGDEIYGNYFDGCSLRADRYGVGLKASNFFQNTRLYTPYVFYSSGGSYVPANMDVSHNSVNFYTQRTPIVSVNFTYNSDGTITAKNGFHFTGNHIGGIFEINPGQRTQIWEVVNDTTARVKRISTSDLVATTNYTADMNPTTVLIVNNEAQQTSLTRPGLAIFNNIPTINNSTGLTTLNSSIEYNTMDTYRRSIFKSDGAVLYNGLFPIIFQRSTDDNGSISWRNFSNVVAAQIGLSGGALFMRAGTTSGRAFLLEQTQFRPETDLLMNAGSSLYRWKEGHFAKLSVGTGASIASNVEFQVNSTTGGVLLPRMTTTEIITNITSPPKGLMVFNTTLNTICFFDGGAWQKVTSASMN